MDRTLPLCKSQNNNISIHNTQHNFTYRVVLSFLGLAALVATLHEGWREYRNQPINIKEEGLSVRVLHCFSSLNCGRKLLSTDVKSSENLNCLNGIRVLSTTWVVMGHSFLQASWHTMFNGIFLLQVSLYRPNTL